MDIISLVVNALFRLEFEWSDIENSLIANQSWRYPNSFWGKLSKVVFGRNRASQRAKIMNLWRANRTKIHHKFLSFSKSSEHDKPVLNLPISINIQQFPPSFFLTRAGKSLIPSYQSNTLENEDSISTSSVDSDFTSIHPEQNNSNCTHFHEQFGEFSSLDNLVTNTTTEIIDQSKRKIPNSIEFSLNKREWDIICPQINAKPLNPEWTNIFSQKLSNHFPFCVIKFLYHRINKKSTIRNTSYLVGEATCKFKNCLEFQFWLKDAPELVLILSSFSRVLL